MDLFYHPSFPDILFFAMKAGIVVLAIILSILIPFMIIRKLTPMEKSKKKMKIENLKSRHDKYIQQFKQKTMNKKDFKAYLKNFKKSQKENKDKPSLFVLSFDGDIMASQVNNLREEISLILEVVKAKDEVVLLLDSRGGSVSHYGLAANQLQRLRNHNIPLSICVDKVAGSGGYLMACVGNQIIASPFAFIGSIGVLFGVPNVHEFLKKHNISYEEFTAGKYKRTVTPLGKITDEKKERLKQQLELIHNQFKNFVRQYRKIDLEQTATGEAWLAEEALKKGLIDKLQCSDDYIMEKFKSHNVYKINLKIPKHFMEKFFNKRPIGQTLLKDFGDQDFFI